MTARNFARLTAPLAIAFAALHVTVPSASAAGFSVSVEAGYRDLTNSPKSADALFETRGGPTFGAGIEVGLGRSFFAGLSGRFLQLDGERVAVGPNDEVFPLGHPLTLRMVPIYGNLGWRFLPDHRLAPYVGLGAGVTMVREESTVGGVTESASSTKPSGRVFGGLAFGQGRFKVAAELAYEMVPDGLGDGGVSEVFDESDLGGGSAVIKLVLAP